MAKPESSRPRKVRGRPPIDVDVEAVLEAATDVFAEAGPVSATMDQIAERSGYSKPRLYDRFGSKRGIFEAVVDHQMQRVMDHLFSAYAEVEGERPIEQLRRGYAAVAEFVRENRPAFRLLFDTTHPSSVGEDPLKKRRETLIRRIAVMVRRSLEEADLPTGKAEWVFARMIHGLGEQIGRACAEDPSLDEKAVVDLVTAFTAIGFAGLDPDLVTAVAGSRRRRRSSAAG